jgi:glycerol-3-phosphate acyltransferase PlsY
MDVGRLALSAVVVALGYLIGGIPWGVIVARAVGGPDPRTVGSGRTGGANVMRVLGPRLALLSGLLDMGKGVVAVLIARAIGLDPAVEVLAGIAALVGHSRSPYLGFRGGRGVSAGFGALLVLSPLAALAILPVFVGLVIVTRYSSIGSLAGSAVGGAVLGALTIATPLPTAYLGYAIGGPVLIWLFHADNIRRLLAGTERRIDDRA